MNSRSIALVLVFVVIAFGHVGCAPARAASQPRAWRPPRSGPPPLSTAAFERAWEARWREAQLRRHERGAPRRIARSPGERTAQP